MFKQTNIIKNVSKHSWSSVWVILSILALLAHLALSYSSLILNAFNTYSCSWFNLHPFFFMRTCFFCEVQCSYFSVNLRLKLLLWCFYFILIASLYWNVFFSEFSTKTRWETLTKMFILDKFNHFKNARHIEVKHCYCCLTFMYLS